MINNPLLEAVDASFQQEVRSFLAHELAPRAAAIEDQQDWNAVKAAVQAVGEVQRRAGIAAPEGIAAPAELCA